MRRKEKKTNQNLTTKKSLNTPNIIFLVTLITMFDEARFSFNKLYSNSFHTRIHVVMSLEFFVYAILFAWFGFNEPKHIGSGVWFCAERVRFTVPDPLQLITTCDPVILDAFFFISSCCLCSLFAEPFYGWQNLNISEFYRLFTVFQYTVTQCQCQRQHRYSNLLSYVLCVASVASSSPKSFVIFFFHFRKNYKNVSLNSD